MDPVQSVYWYGDFWSGQKNLLGFLEHFWPNVSEPYTEARLIT
jgi:hypothetical protein